jgi:hypothetical protein
MDDNAPQNNEQTPATATATADILAEANLWNPLWVYDLFPIYQSSWNRMPIAGADFETESSHEPQPNPEPNNNPEQDSSNSPDDEENSDDESNNNTDDNDDDSPDEPGDDQSDSDADSSTDDDDNNTSESGDDDDTDEDRNGDSDDGDEDSNDEIEPEDQDNSDANDEDGPDLDQNEPNDEPDNTNDSDNLDETDPDRSNEYSLEEPKHVEPNPIPGLTIMQTDAGLEYIREFNSWEDFVECAADKSLYGWKQTCESHNPKQGTAGAGATWTEAIEMARYRGWPEGRELLSDLLTNITQKSENFEIWAFDVAGMFPVVPAFLSGDPACMIVDPGTDLRTQFPIIRIDYNHEVSWNITPQDMMIRGAAVLSLANNLEAHGFQTELRIIANSQAYIGRKPAIFRYSIIYKKPGQFLDIDRAAFALAHPACMRRLGFALLEQHAELEAGFKDSYGSPLHSSNDPDSGSFGTIFIPGSLGRETEAKSRTVVMAAAEATTSALATAEAD